MPSMTPTPPRQMLGSRPSRRLIEQMRKLRPSEAMRPAQEPAADWGIYSQSV